MPLLEQQLTPGVMLSAGIASMGGFLYGADNGWFSTAIGIDVFNDWFGSKKTIDATTGVVTHSLTASEQSAGTSLGSVGIILGCAMAAPLGRIWGRRMSVTVMSIIAIIGIIIEIFASVHGFRYWQLVVGKLINSISMGIAGNCVPTYQSELAPPKWRGLVVNLYQCVQIIGLIVTTASIYALSSKQTKTAWQLPIGLQFIAPVFLLCAVPFMPESPRWLVWKGRFDEAEAVLNKINKYDSGKDEVELLRLAFEEERRTRPPSVFAVFQGSDLRRTLIATGMQCLQAAQGSSYMSSYIVLFLEDLGMTNIFQIVMVVDCVYFAAVVISFWLPDLFGRRFLLMTGGAICGVCLLMVSAINVGLKPETESGKRAVLGLIFIWYFFFGLVWSPLTWITCAEVCSARTREMTMAVATFSGFTVQLIINIVSPYIQDAGYGNIGGSIGFIWTAFTFIAIFFVYFFVPEMKGLTLETLDILFDRRVATRDFQRYAKEHNLLTEEGLEQELEKELASGEIRGADESDIKSTDSKDNGIVTTEKEAVATD